MNLNQYQKCIYSQYGQDGILEKIFDVIGTTNKYFVEFGSSGNDIGMGNTPNLRKKGFDGLLMDGSEHPYNNVINDKKYEVKIEFITASNINQLFEKYNVPREFDFLSIDIDGQDFHVWNKLNNYSPRVVCIEICYHIELGNDKVMMLDDNWVWKGDHLYGSSLTALKNLGNKKGYSLVATCYCDAIFIRDDLIYDENKNALFTNVNNEYELSKQSMQYYNDILSFNLRHNIKQDMYNIPLFSSSEKYLN